LQDALGIIFFRILIPFFLLFGTFPGFSKSSSKKRQLNACHFSQEFVKIPEICDQQNEVN
jgi:hypothetical protein